MEESLRPSVVPGLAVLFLWVYYSVLGWA